MSLWRVYYHLVWATYDRIPFIEPHHEAQLYGLMKGKSGELRCTVYAIGGMPDHVHLLVSFSWQREYGVFSLGAKQLDTAIAYVDRQKEHHHEGTLIQGLERDLRVARSRID